MEEVDDKKFVSCNNSPDKSQEEYVMSEIGVSPIKRREEYIPINITNAEKRKDSSDNDTNSSKSQHYKKKISFHNRSQFKLDISEETSELQAHFAMTTRKLSGENPDNKELDNFMKNVDFISLHNKKKNAPATYKDDILKLDIKYSENEKIDPTIFSRIHITDNIAEEHYYIQEHNYACKSLEKMLDLRKKYLFSDHSNYKDIEKLVWYKERSKEPKIDYSLPIDIPDSISSKTKIKIIDGVYNVIYDDGVKCEKVANVPHMIEFAKDLNFIMKETHAKKVKSYCFKRLEILSEKFKMHLIYNREKEQIEQQKIVHRDLYNVRKVDTHIHHSASMRAKHLLHFILYKLKTEPDCHVLLDKVTKEPLTLMQVCNKLGVNRQTISLDSLNRLGSKADASIFHRFDRFNNKYNPMGQPELREIFLKTENYINGRFLAEITKEVIEELEYEKYNFVEWRVSIYGRSTNEWESLANWFDKFKLCSHNVRWMIQIPRLYSVYKKNNIINTFQDMIDNIFLPLFNVTINPESNPGLYRLSLQIVGFDTVDDESGYETLSIDHLQHPPDEWDYPENPHYAYWIYYLYSNLYSLNALRKMRGMNTFSLRPHCGESGNVDHLATAFLTSDAINHGIKLEKAPVLQYLYYLDQIGLCLSPLSNNKLFLAYKDNPFPKFFSRGLNVSLSTDDPLIIHLTKEPLLEEYAIAAQVWNLSNVDMAEIAKNSVMHSSYEEILKKHWLGANYKTKNDKNLSNLPDIRYTYRKETLESEIEHLKLLSMLEM